MNETLAIKQTKFNNGEISPSMYGETAHAKYAASLRGCLNWVPTPQGAVTKRSGTQFVGQVGDQTTAPRLIPFVYENGDAFVFEVGHKYIRFYRNGKYLAVDGTFNTYVFTYGVVTPAYFELATPFTREMLPYLKFAQVGNVVTICYGGQASGVAAVAPQDVRRIPSVATLFSISDTPLKIPAGAVTWSAGPTYAVPAYGGTVAWHKGERATETDSAANVVEWICIQETAFGDSQSPKTSNDPFTQNSTNTSLKGNLWWVPAVDLAHPAVKVNYVETLIVQDSDGVVYESAPSPVLTVNTSLGTDRCVPLACSNSSYVLAAGYTLIERRLYRGSAGGAYGLIQRFTYANLVDYPSPTLVFPAATAKVLIDDGRVPDYTKQPPAATDPFLVGAADVYPLCVGHFDQRRLWGGTLRLDASKAGDLYNYDRFNVPGSDADALQVLMVSERLEQVRSIIGMKRCLVLTSQGEWTFSGMGGGPIARNSLDLKCQSGWGSNWLNPLKIGTGMLFCTAKSNSVRDLYPLYGLYADIWDGQDLTVMARHLFDLSTSRDWAFQNVPYPVAWMVRSDGALLSLTYQHAPPNFGQQLAEGIVAWARHSTGLLDDFEAVCSVPETGGDALYVSVLRYVGTTQVRYIERFASLICAASPYNSGVADVRYGSYLDSYVSYDGHADALGFGSALATIDSLGSPGSTNIADFQAGAQVQITVPGGPFQSSDADVPYGAKFVLDPENTLGFGTVRARIVAYSGAPNIVTAELEKGLSQGQFATWVVSQGTGSAAWGIARSRLAAFHLADCSPDTGGVGDARGLLGLVDGDLQVISLWSGGVAYFASPGLVMKLGLAYNSDVDFLDAWHPSAEIRNKFKNLIRVGFEVAGSRDFWCGKDFDNLAQWEQRDVLDAYDVMGLSTGYFESFVVGEWSKGGRAVARHFAPLPAVLSSILREFRLGDS